MAAVNDSGGRKLIRFPTHHRPHLHRHIRRYPAGSWPRRDPSGDLKSAFRRLHVYDPVAEEKLFRLRKDAVSNWHTVGARAYDLGLLWPGQGFGRHELSGFAQILVDPLQVCKVVLDIARGPRPISVHARFRTG